MKLLILSIFIFGTASANYFPMGKEGANTVYAAKANCEVKEGQTCYDVSECSPNRCSLEAVEVPDFDQDPIQVITDEVPCTDEPECQALIAEETFCSDTSYQALWGDRNEDGNLSAWCVHDEYPTKIVKQLVEDQDKIDAINAAAAQRAALSAKRAQMECAKNIQALMALRNDQKGLNPGQRKQFVAQFSEIKDLMDTGSLQAALEEVQAVQPDGTLVTQDDIDAVAGLIQGCL